MNKLPNIGLIGRKQVGKSAAGDYLADMFSYQIRAFADPMRAMARAINPIIGNTPAGPLRLTEAEATYGYDRAKEIFPEFRRFLQTLGTEGGRKVLGETIWVDTFVKGIMPLLADQLPIVVTDVRFQNEADALSELGFTLIRIVQPGRDESDVHPSETSLDDYIADFTIFNERTRGDLYDELDRILDILIGRRAA